MRKILTLCVLMAMVCVKSWGQVTTNGGSGLAASYSTLSSAITALNSATISSPVVITLSGNETAPAGGYVITATGTSVNTITIQGSNSIITANASPTAGSLLDAIIKIVGGDNITIDRFTLQENANTTTAYATNNLTEFGIAQFYASTTNGAQNNTIKNCTISLNANYQNAIGIYSTERHSSTSATTPADATSNAGLNSGFKVYSNTISNVAFGVVFISAPNTSTVTESGFDVGGTSSATGNTITFGNSTSADGTWNGFSTQSTGIQYRNGVAANIQYNTINTIAGGLARAVNGITISAGTTPTGVTYTNTISNNTIGLTVTSTGQTNAIDFGYGLSTGTIIGNSNNITVNQTVAATVSSSQTGINAAYAAATITTNSNTVVINQTTSGAGTTSSSLTGVNISGAGTTNTAQSNAIAVNQTTSSTSAVTSPVTGISATAAANTLNIGSAGNANTITIKQAVTGSGSYGSGAITYVDLGSIGHGTVNVVNNTFNTTGSTIRSTGALNCVNQGSTTITTLINIKNNTAIIDRIAISGTVGFFTQTSTIPNDLADTLSSNTITFTNLAGTSSVTTIQKLGGSTSANRNINNNIIFISGTNTGTTIGISSGYSALTNATGNSITISCAAPTVTGIIVNGNNTASTIIGNAFSLASSTTSPTAMQSISLAGGGAHSVTGNTFSVMNFTGVISGSPVVSAIAIGGGSGANIFSNVVNNISVGAATSAAVPTIDGILISGGTSANVYKNKIYGITTAATGIGTVINGIRLSGGTTNNVYNNLIGNLTATAASSADAIRGISITSTTTSSTNNIYFNTVYLNASSSGTNFGTSGIYHAASTTATTATLDLKNNIIVNTSTANGTGLTVAFRRSLGTAGYLANYKNTSPVSNNNDFYAGTPSSANLIYYDGTSSAQTLSAYAGGVFTAGTVAPRDAASISENPTFINTSGSSASFLHINTSAPTIIEGTGLAISGITDDYDGDIRSSNTPTDIGADAGLFTPIGAAITLGSNNIAAGNLTGGTANNPVYSFSIASSNTNATLTGLNITTAGTYASADITNLKVWYSASATFTVANSTLLSTLPTPGTAGAKTFTFTANATIASGSAGYIFITADLPCAAIGSNTISVNAVTSSNTTFTSGTVSGTPAAGNTQTIVAAIPTAVTDLTASVANQSSVLAWTAPTGCYNEVLIVATAGAVNNNGLPTGDGTAYTANAVFGTTGTGFGNGYVVYKGTASPETVTGLTNGTAYYYKIFTRLGTVWTAGNEISAVPALAYCVTSPSTGGTTDIITNVTLTNSLSTSYSNASTYHTTAPAYYDSYNNTPLNLTRGSTTNTIAITFGSDGTQHSAVWIDFDQNGIFDASENIALSSAAAGSNATVTYTFTIPSGAALGNTRMRVRGASDNVYTASGACTTSIYGETEDYLVNIVAPITYTWTGTTSTDWNTATNWSGNTVPTSTSTVTIATTANQPVISATATASSIILNSGTSLTINSTLTVGGNWTNNGATSVTGTGSVVLNGTTTIGGTATTTFPNLTITGTVAQGINTTVTGNYSQTAGAYTVTPGAAAYTLTVGGTFTQSAGTFNVTGSSATAGATVTVSGATSIFSILFEPNSNNTASTILFQVNGNVTLTGTSTSTALDWMAGGTGGTLYPVTFGIKGNLNWSGTGSPYTSGSGTAAGFTFNGTGTIASPQTLTYNGSTSGTYIGHQYIVNSGTVLQLQSSIAESASSVPYNHFTVNGILDAQNNVISGGNSTISVGAASGFFLNAGATLITKNTSGVTGTVTDATVSYNAAANYIFNGTSAQNTNFANTTMANLTISNSAGVTNNAAATVNGILTFTMGKLFTTTANTITLGTAVITSGASATSYVNGPLIRLLPASPVNTTVYDFPVGATTYLPYSITNVTTTAATSLQVQAFTGAPTGTADGTTVNAVSNTEYWKTTSLTGYGGASVNIARQSALGNLNVAGKSATNAAASYSSVGGTVSGNGVVNSVQTGSFASGATQYYALAQADYTITSSVSSGNTTGTITPNGTTNVPYNTSQLYTITPAANYHIADVKADGVTDAAAVSSGTYTFSNVSASHTIVAAFAINTYILTYTAGSNGSITGTSPQTVTYGGSGSAVTAVANTGYHFVNWSDGSTSNPRTDANVTAAISVTANFAVNTYTITYNSNGASGGSAPNDPNSPYTNNSTATVLDNTGGLVKTGYTFTSWNTAADGSGTTYVANNTFTITANVILYAQYTINTYTIVSSVTSGAATGTIAPDGTNAYNYGTSQTYIITPAIGYHISDVTVDGSSVGTVSSYPFNNITTNHTISATFVINQFTITSSVSGGNGTISPNGTTTVNYGDNQTFIITPNTNYSIQTVLVDGVNDPTAVSTGTYTFTNVTANGHTVVATFYLTSCPNPPTANAGSDGSMCAGSIYTLNGSSIGGGASTATWSSSGTGTFSPNSTYAGNGVTTYIPSAADIAAGSIVITLTTDNPNPGICTAATASFTITINAVPVTSINGGATQGFCTGSSVILTSSSTAGSGTITNYQWNLNGSPISSANGNTYTASTAGSYTLTVTNSNNCSATSAAVTVSENAVPTTSVDGSASQSFCANSSLPLTSTNTAGSGSITAYQWNLNGSPISNATASSYLVTVAGSYTLTVTNSNGCSTTSAAVTVTANPAPTVSINGASAVAICANSSLTFSSAVSAGSGATVTSYQWNLNGVPINGATSASYSTATAGSYTLTVTNSFGCVTTSSAVVLTVNALPTVTASANCSTIYGGTITLTATANAGSGTITGYQWYLNGSAVSGATSSTYTTGVAGSYTVTATNSNTCISDPSAAVIIGAASGPLAAGTYTIGGNGCNTFTTLANALIYLNANGIAGPVVFNIPAGYTETAPAASGFVLGSATLNGTLTATSTLTFIKSGTGNSPVLTAAVGTTNYVTATGSIVPDGIFSIRGADYVTMDGLTFTDNNSTNSTKAMEFGVGMFKTSVIDGCNNNTIQNCTFNMQRVNNAVGAVPLGDGSVAIGIYNSIATDAATPLTPTATSGANSNNKIYANTINGGNTGIDIYGYTNATAPYSYTDQGNDIGGTSVSTGNIILNFGGGATTNAAVGIRTGGQYGLNVSYNTINNNNGTGVNHATTLRGIYLQPASGASETVSYNTITISSGAVTNLLAGIENAAGGTANSNTVNITNNTIVTNYAAATSGYTFGIYNNGVASSNLNINSNAITLNTAATSNGSVTTSNYAIYQTGAVASALNINSNNITETFTAASTSATTRGIYNSAGATTATINILSNTFNGVTFSGGTGGSGTYYGIYQTASVANQNIKSNTFNGFTFKSTGDYYMIYPSNSSTNVDISGNVTSGTFTRTGSSGAFYGIYGSGSTTGTSNVYNNNLSNINNGSSTGAVYMLYYGNGATMNIYGNTISSVTATSGTGGFYGIYPYFYGATKSIYGNSVSNVTYAGTVYGLYDYGYYTTAGSIYSNTFSNLSTSGNAITAMFLYETGSAGGNTTIYNIYKNKITDITATGASGVATGINDNAQYGGTVNAYNNLIGNIAATASTSSAAVSGITLSTATGYSAPINLSYNTIYLSGTSSGSGFGSSGIYQSNTYSALTLKNNVIDNLTVPTGSGLAVALRRSSASLSSYASASNNNDFYGGTPGSAHLIYYDGTNSDQTLAAFKTRVSSDQSSVTENPVFISTTGTSSNFLHINTTIPTTLESGGTPVSGITDDYDGTDIRNTTTPDIGADEFNGISASPAIANVTVPTASCTVTSHPITADITTAVGTITSVVLNYKNGTTGSVTMTLVSGNTYTGTIPAGTPGTTVTWSITATNSGGYTKIYTGSSYIDAPLTGITATATASPATICAGSSTILNGNFTGSGTVTIGTGTTQTPYYSYPTAFGNYEYQDWSQMVYTASELQAAGLRAGNITALTFTIGALPSPGTVNTYSIRLGSTTNATLSGFTTTGLTTVYSAASVTPVIGANTITFTTPYVWDGTSNILVDIRGTGQFGSANATTYFTATSGNTVVYGYSATNNTGFYTSNPTATASTSRLNIKLAGNAAVAFTSYSWSNGTATVGATNPLTITPSATTAYTVTATDANNCMLTSSPVTVTVTPLPTAPATINSIQCGTGTPGVSASGGTNSQYRWYTAATGGTAIAGQTNSTLSSSYTISTTTTFYVAVNNGTCESDRTPVTATVTTPDIITASASPAPICLGGSTTLTATQTGATNTYTYTWTCTSTNAGTSGISGSVTGNPVMVTPTVAGTYTYLVTANDPNSCTTTNTINVTVNALPVIASATASSSKVCSGTAVTLTATTATNTAFNVGVASDAATNLTAISGYGMYFSSANASTINSVDIYPSTAGTLTIQLLNASSTVVDSRSFTIASSDVSTTVKKTLALGFSIPAGSAGWQLYYSNLSINRGAGTYIYPSSSNGFSITGNTFDGNSITSGTRYYFYNWNVSANSQGAGTYNWVWNPGSLSGNIVTVNPTASTIYTATATDPATGCSNTSSPVTVTIASPLSGIYTIGPSGNYPTLTAAVSDYNTLCLGGPVTFALQSNYTSSGETFPVVVNANSNASSTNTLTIKPANGATAAISGSSASAIIKINGADYVTIDGSNSGGTDRSLTITNTNTSTSGTGVWLASTATDGATNNTVKNVIVKGNASTTTFADILSSGSTLGNAAEVANNNNRYVNDSVTTAQYGIGVAGASGEAGTIITGNSIGSTIAAQKMGFRGIFIFNQTGVTISANTITGVSSANSSSTNPSGGIIVAGAIINGVVTKNKLTDIKNTSSSGWASYGISLQSSTASTGLTVSDNFISDVAGYGVSTLTDNGVGIAVIGGGGYNIYYNSVSLATNQTSTAGYSADLYIASGTTGLNVVNNIFSNTQTTGNRYAVYDAGTNSVFTTINYNDYYIAAGGYTGYLSASQAAISNWQAATGQDVNSVAVNPQFIAATNLHLKDASALNGLATPIASITTDIDGDARNATIPDIGADEFTPQSCSGSNGGTATYAGGILCTEGSALITATGYAEGLGVQYQWQYSSDNFVSDIHNLTGETNADSLNTGNITETTYFRLSVTCSGSTGYSNIVTVSVNTPTVTGTTPNSRCGTGTVTLQATGSANTTVNWYDASNGGNLVATGNSFTTPSISATTIYYVNAVSTGVSTVYGGRAAPSVTTNTTPSGYGLVFDAATAFTLNTVDVYNAGASGTVTIQMQNSSGTALQTTTVTVPAATGTTPYTVSLNWNVAKGNAYRLMATSGTASLVREFSGAAFPYALGSAGSITSGYILGISTAYYYFYNWQITSGCASARTAVTATVNSQPTAVTVTPNAASICASSIQQLTATGGSTTATTTVLSENFNNNAPGWTISNSNYSSGITNFKYQSAPYTDASGSATFSNFSTSNGGKFAYSNSDAGGSGSATNTKLISPVFSTAGLTSATLTFEQVYQKWTGVTQADTTVALEISTDGGSTWSVLKDYKTLGSQGTVTSDAQATILESIGLSSYLNQSNLRLRFNYNTGWGFYWIIDNVNVTGTQPTTPAITWSPVTGLYTDAAATSLYTGGAVFTVYAKPLTSTTYTATAANSNSTCSSSNTGVITVNALPDASLSASHSICAGSGSGVVISSTSGGTVYYHTSTNATEQNVIVPSSGGITLTDAPTQTTVYTLDSVKSSAGCMTVLNNVTSTVTIGPLAPLVLTSGTGTDNQVVCKNTPITAITYTTISPNVITVSNTGGLNVVGNGTSAVSISGSTLVNITYTVTTSGGSCPSTANGTVSIQTAAIWTGNTSTDWSEPTNWCSGSVPLSTDNVEIPAVTNLPVLSADITINGLTIDANATVTIGAHTFTTGAISGSGTITGSATSNLITTASGTVTFTTGSDSLHNLTVRNGTLTLGTTLGIVAGTNADPSIVTVADGAHIITNDGLTLKSGINGTASIAANTSGLTYITGNVTVERYTNGGTAAGRRAWRLMTSPVTNTTIHQAWQENAANTATNPLPGYGTLITGEGLIQSKAEALGFDYIGGGNHTSIKQYVIDGAGTGTNSWMPLTDQLSTGTAIDIRSQQAYLLFVRGDRSIKATGANPTNLRATGILLQGKQTVPLSAGNFTLIGNPYASTIDFGSIYTNNSALIQDQFYLWNSKYGTYGAYVLVDHQGTGGAYEATPETINGTATSGNNYRYIPSGTGFFVSPATPGMQGDVVIGETDKVAGSTPPVSPFRVVATNVRQLLVNLNQVNSSDTSTTLADGFRAKFSNDYVGNEEESSSTKTSNLNENLGLVRNDTDLIIEARSDVQEGDTLFMKLWNVTKRSYQFQVKADNFTTLPSLQAWLVDNYLGTKQPISLQGDVTTLDFSVTGDSLSSKSDRFLVVFGNSAVVLPVTLTSVKAAPQNGGVSVTWTVSNETNIKGYTLERSADGGRTYTGIGAQQAAKNSGGSGYQGFDSQPQKGDNLYRIRIEAKEGTVTYSSVVKATIGEEERIEITLYPNPMREGKVNLQMTHLPQGTYEVKVYSQGGQTVYQRQITVSGSRTSQSEELRLGKAIAQGAYQLRLTDSRGKVLYANTLVVGR